MDVNADNMQDGRVSEKIKTVLETTSHNFQVVSRAVVTDMQNMQDTFQISTKSVN